jgi:hypothetical protein
METENPEWTAGDFASARPASELPAELRKAFPRTRGPQKAPKNGPGWQSRMDDALRKAAGLDA